MTKNKTIGYYAPQFYGSESAMVLGDDFMRLIEKYRIPAKERYADWPEKRASLSFMYEGKPYHIGKRELQCDDMQFVMIESELTDELYELGAYDIFYSGMLD